MKPRNREVSIFNMSVLDLLTGALGAFCFLTLALFPYYFKAQSASASPAPSPSASANNADIQAQNERLKQQIELEKKSGKQMPPFVLMYLGAANPSNNSDCATISIKSVTPPPGAPAIGYRAITPSQNGASAYFLFLQRVGDYQFEVEASPTSTPCTVTLDVENVGGTAKSHPITQSEVLHFNFQITGDDFPSSLFD
jgi:hypothetical protein